ncbi:response regulator [Alphaproteobacteria bacterium]|nr:response regulator [Alphaproteobacteria bacterium]
MANILLAEDDSAMQTFLNTALKKAGHTVRTEKNGLDALAALNNTTEPFDLLLTDIVMPGMDGIELSQKAMKKHPALKVMFITGFAAVAMDEQKNRAHNTKILSKPFHLNDLVQQIETLLAA